MKIIIENKQAKLKRIINEEIVKMHDELTVSNKQILEEGWISRQLKKIPDLFGLVSGTGGLDAVEAMASPDAWMMFRAIVGPGTDEDTIREILLTRRNDIVALDAEFNEIIEASRKFKQVTANDANLAINPFAGDKRDGHTFFTPWILAFAGVVGIAVGDIPFALFLATIGVTNHMAGVLASPNKGKKRNKERAQGSTGGPQAILAKLYTKIANTIEDKSLEDYLRDDGMNREADMVRDAIAIAGG
jgi:hypothetical protein